MFYSSFKINFLYIDLNICHMHEYKELSMFPIMMCSEMGSGLIWMDIDDYVGLCVNCLMLTLGIVKEIRETLPKFSRFSIFLKNLTKNWTWNALNHRKKWYGVLHNTTKLAIKIVLFTHNYYPKQPSSPP